MSTPEWLEQIRSFPFPASMPRPRLLYGRADLASMRERAALHPEWVRDIRQEAERVSATVDQIPDQDTEPYYHIPALEAVSDAYLITADPEMAQVTETMIYGFLDKPQWVAHVHWPMPYDHAAANTASAVARALDAISDILSPARLEELCHRLLDKAVVPFVQACRERGPFWSRRSTESNWRIMTCGDSGLAVLATAEFNPDLHEALAFAAEGVLDTLDFVPAQGDWPEGAGYWLGTLGLGLRFCLALYRATDGQIDLFAHPALGTTGDYIAHLIKPNGSVYNFNDNRPTVDDRMAYLTLLAQRRQRPDWGWVASGSQGMSMLRLILEDPSFAVVPPSSRAACFTRTGVAMLRSGWEPHDTFVGFKSGPSDVGHSHVDANSFVVSMRGADLLREEGTWPYDHPHGFFDVQDRRWDWDANATVAHNTLLVDGTGQTHGPGNAGQIEAFADSDSFVYVIGEASAAYPDLLKSFRRWLVYVRPDLVVLLDEIECDQPRHLEWLFHYAGSMTGDRGVHVIQNDGAAATLRWLKPESERLWRVADVVRTTYYQDANSRQDVAMNIRYRSMGPIHRTQSLEALYVISAGQPDDWSVQTSEVTRDAVSLTMLGPQAAAWTISLDRSAHTVSVSRTH
jgi:hypothetical protein